MGHADLVCVISDLFAIHSCILSPTSRIRRRFQGFSVSRLMDIQALACVAGCEVAVVKTLVLVSAAPMRIMISHHVAACHDPQERRQGASLLQRRGEQARAEWLRLRLSQMRLERPRQWGGCWLSLQLWRELALDEFWLERLPPSRKGTRWDEVMKILVVYQAAFARQRVALASRVVWPQRTAGSVGHGARR
jgi:hypothetical protein